MTTAVCRVLGDRAEMVRNYPEQEENKGCPNGIGKAKTLGREDCLFGR